MVINELNLGPAMRWGIGGLCLLGGVLALYLAQSFFIPLVIVLLLAAMLWPAVRWMNQGLGFSWPFSCMIMVFGLVVLNILIMIGLGLSIPKLLQDVPRSEDGQAAIYENVRERLQQICPVPLEDFGLPTKAEKSALFHEFRKVLEGDYLIKALADLGIYANGLFWVWVFIMFLLLFMLLEGPMLTRRVAEIFGPSEEVKAHATRALSDMALQVRTYLVWRTIINFGLALLVGMVYQWVGLSQAWTWAILTAVLCYVPYLGPIAAGILPIIDGFISVSPWCALAILVFYLIVITLEGYLVFPVVMGRSMELNATTVILACLFWELIWGLPGLFLAMPLMAAIKAICTNVPDWQVWANLMSNRAAESAPGQPDGQPPAVYDKTQVMLPEEITDLEKPRPERVKQK
jgi:predicted PurR-regulated permease PerM